MKNSSKHSAVSCQQSADVNQIKRMLTSFIQKLIADIAKGTGNREQGAGSREQGTNILLIDLG
ncbi:MAG: hypothetical protein F6K26_01025 [Moorea sp. SIO2I5]|nr:hypothetical protein [Moorena sp. SIO2I5]